MGKHKKKHKKENKSKEHKAKKSKKHKAKKSKKHYKKSFDSSDSSSSNDAGTSSDSSSSDYERTENVRKENISKFSDEDEWNDLFSNSHSMSKEKNIGKKDRDILDRPGQSARELNPYWKDGGTGLPPERKISDKYDVKELRKILEAAKDKAETTGMSLEKIVEEKCGPLSKLKQLIGNAEEEYHDKTQSVQSFKKMTSQSKEGRIDLIEQRQRQFMKPGEFSSSTFTNTHSRNWKKKDITKSDEPIVQPDSSSAKNDMVVVKENKKILTPDEMNALAAKAMKAEIMGNKSLAAELRKQIEDAKNSSKSALAGRTAERQKEEVILLTETNIRGMTRPLDSSSFGGSHKSGRKRRGETHHGNERVRYFLDDDKHSLNSMFENEKFGTTDKSDELFLKMAKKGKLGHSNDDNDLDDDFLDRVRRSDLERKADEKGRHKALNEAKAKHKSVSGCRWCLDGSNVQKHLIVSVGIKCYLCLPSDESLTEGHCLIVPVHHETCGTMLDEDVWNEMQLYRKCLCKMFEDSGQDVVFFENARSFHRFPHMVLSCVPMDREVGDLAPIYFKKAIMESETEWSNNKKVVDLSKKDLRRSIPKGLAYFAVDFGKDGGFAHVIEDEKLFPPNFAEEIIGGMLDLDVSKWRKRRRESFEQQKEKVIFFKKTWQKYDLIKSGRETLYKSSESPSSDS